MQLKHFRQLDIYHTNVFKNHFWIRARFNELCKLLRYKKISIHKNEKILDIGVGRGILAEQLFDKFKLKIDLNELKKVFFSKYITKSKYNNFYYGNFLKVKFKKKYDKIFLFDVIEHLSKNNLSNFFFKINNMLNKDGLVIINVPSLSFLYSKYDEAIGHNKRYRIKDFYDLSKKFRFEIIYVSYWGLFYIPLLLLRKFYSFFSSKNIVSNSFKVNNEMLNYLLFKLYSLETFLVRVPCGTSIICILKKMK